MSKVDILRLDSVTASDTTATASINTNFKNIQDTIETLLSRDGATPNYMQAVLDMNSNRIINTADPVDPLDVVNLKYVQETLGDLTQYVTDAQNAAQAAEAKAQSAAGSATAAASSMQAAQTASAQAIASAREAKEYRDTTKGYYDDIVAGNYQTVANLVTSLSSSSTDSQYPSAKCVYDLIGDIESVLSEV